MAVSCRKGAIPEMSRACEIWQLVAGGGSRGGFRMCLGGQRLVRVPCRRRLLGPAYPGVLRAWEQARCSGRHCSLCWVNGLSAVISLHGTAVA